MIRQRLLSSCASPVPFIGPRFTPNIRQLLAASPEINHAQEVTVSGWIKSFRRQKNVSFAVVTDGSSAIGLQTVFVGTGKDSAEVKRLTNGAAVRLTGRLVASPGKGQDKELLVDLGNDSSASFQPGRVELLGECPHDVYPIQKQALSNEYLRDHAHLRARTDKIAAMIRLRSVLQRGVNDWFNNQGFYSVNTPILTGNDAEGAGEAFRVAPVEGEHPAATQQATSSSPSSLPSIEFFSRPAYLTVSHQLHLEALASALSRVYTLSPCFRAEPSLTARHLAEFWMLEAEWAFSAFGTNTLRKEKKSTKSDTEELCQVVETMLRFVLGGIVTGSEPNDELSVLWQQNHEDQFSLVERAVTAEHPWTRMSYSESINELRSYHATYATSGGHMRSTRFQYEPSYGKGLQSEHEHWLASQLVGGPVFVTDYPASLKPFYMRLNSRQLANSSTDEAETVACFDLLVPNVGELVGGSVREERLDVLSERMEKAGMGGPEYEWYRDLRKYGGAPHAGFGMGFERLVAWVGGVDNVREAIPIPRWAGRMLL